MGFETHKQYQAGVQGFCAEPANNLIREKLSVYHPKLGGSQESFRILRQY